MKIKLAALLILCFSTATLVHAQPANDAFTNALTLTGTNGFVTGSNAGGTKQAGEPSHAGNAGGSSVWYSWQAPSNVVINFYTFGSGFDTLLAVYTGAAVNALTLVAANDDEAGTLQSFVQFAATAGTTYRIAVDGWGGDTGDILLSWQPTQPSPAQASIVSAGPLTNILVAADGSFQVRHVLFADGQIFPNDEDFADSGFFVRHAGGAVSGPNFTNRATAAESTMSRAFFPVSQTVSSNGLEVTTVMDNRNDGTADSFQVTQVTRYRPGDEFFTVQNTISNQGPSSFTADLFAAADSYLADSDFGYGFINAGAGTVGGSDSNRVFHIFIQNQPGNPVPAFYQEDFYDEIWATIGTGSHFANTISSAYLDNGAGIEWPNVTIAPGVPLTVTYLWSFGTAADLGVGLIASPNPVNVGATLTYQALVANSGPGAATNVVLTDTLPGSVSFVSASSTSGSCSNVGGTITCSLAPIAPGESNLVTIVVQPNTAGSISNTVAVSGSQADVNLVNNASTFFVMAVAAIPPPGITQEPTNTTVALSSNATFSVVATGAPPLTYQWRFESTDIPDATNASYTITNAQFSNMGRYEVEVTNPGGTVVSATARLTLEFFDFGDAPNAYKTLLADNGARHKLVRMLGANSNFLTLSFGLDAETDGKPNSTATGDDVDNSPDEDGVSFLTPLVPGQPATILVISSHAAKLDAWIDFNANGSWGDAGEKIFDNKALIVDQNRLTFDVPANAVVGNTFARFRLSTAGGLSFTGQANNGEVEDHSVSIREAPAAGVGVRGPFVFKNTSGFDAATLEVVFLGSGGLLTAPWITMEPENANGVASFFSPAGNRNRVLLTFQNKIPKGSMVAFTVQCPNTMGVNSAEWGDGAAALFDGALYADLDQSRPIPAAPEDKRMRIRKSYKAYTAADLNLLTEAMLLLHDPAKSPPRDTLRRLAADQALKPGDPHDRYEEYVLMHDISQNTAHGSSHFTPWHRKLLLDFENDLRALGPKYKDITVPFWDWTLNNNNPFSDFLGGNGTPADGDRVAGGPFGKTQNQWRTYAYQFSIKNWQRGYLKRTYANANFNLSDLRLRGPAARTKALDDADYAEFRKNWEHARGTHDPAHGWVGGDLGNPTQGVNEPGFWLLHSFIDETWAEWQCKHGTATYKKFPNLPKYAADAPMLGFPDVVPASDTFNFLTQGFSYERPAGTRIDDDKCKINRFPRLFLEWRGLFTYGLSAETGVGFHQLHTSTDLLTWSIVETFLATNSHTELGEITMPTEPQRYYRLLRLGGGPSGNTFVIDAFTGGAGQISPEGVITANGGSTVNFTATPVPGSAVENWYVDGTLVQGGGNSFTLTNVQADHFVSVGFYDLLAETAELTLSLTPSLTTASNGQPVTYTVQVHNDGPHTANTVTVMFEPQDMPQFSGIITSQGTFTLMGGAAHTHGVMFSLGSLAASSNATITVTLLHHDPGAVTTLAWVSAEERDSVADDNADEAIVTITGSPDARKAKGVDVFCGPGFPRR